MDPIVIRVMFAPGIVGHALNLHCDRLLSATSNGTFTVSDFKDLHDAPRPARHFEDVSPASSARCTSQRPCPCSRD